MNYSCRHGCLLFSISAMLMQAEVTIVGMEDGQQRNHTSIRTLVQLFCVIMLPVLQLGALLLSTGRKQAHCCEPGTLHWDMPCLHSVKNKSGTLYDPQTASQLRKHTCKQLIPERKNMFDEGLQKLHVQRESAFSEDFFQFEHP